jgi:hypothetical protein
MWLQLTCMALLLPAASVIHVAAVIAIIATTVAAFMFAFMIAVRSRNRVGHKQTVSCTFP